jgi:hypothetical protein
MVFQHLRNVQGFFSDYYLGSIFGRGSGRGKKRKLSDRDSDLSYARFRRLWQRAEGRCPDAPACREKFIRPLLRDVLGFHLGEGEERVHGLYPDADAEAQGNHPLLLAYTGSWGEDLDAGKGKARPLNRLRTRLARLGLRYGLLLTGENLRLVRAAGEGPQGAFLEADLSGLAEDYDPESFAAFWHLFSLPTFSPSPEGVVPIEAIEKESLKYAEKVSEDLKGAVFRACETMVRGLLADAQEQANISSITELTAVSLETYRDAALTALYRLLFILYAEARDPRLSQHQVYWQAYSVHGLVETLLQQSLTVWPENRASFWSRLKASFSVYHDGLPAIGPYENLPSRGGDFFSPATPDGAILERARLSDRLVSRVVLDLTTTQPRPGVGRERVSFRELDIEQLGAVYEGLLEYEPRLAREITLELRVQGKTMALTPEETVRLCREKNLVVKGDRTLVAGTAAETLHAEATSQNDETEEPDLQPEGEESEPGGEEEETGPGVKKGAAVRLLRRLEPGDFHFVPSPARKGSGSFYTPLPLVRDLVRHALGPLVTGKTPLEIESLRVLDPACGSAHFLVEAMRYLGRALHRAYVEEYDGQAPPQFRSTTGVAWDGDFQVSDEEARAAGSEARAWCKRRIAERCLFGVDLNPMAVKLARVALWIESLAGDRPLTFFHHHVRCGNSLLGTWKIRLCQPPLPGMAKVQHDLQPNMFAHHVRQALMAAAQARLLIDAAGDSGAVEAESLEELSFKAHQQRTAAHTLAGARLLFDLRSASAFLPEIWGEWATCLSMIEQPEELLTYVRSRPWWQEFRQVCERERFFHWELEFPEVFLNGKRPGFDAILGNPPWDKVLPAKVDFYQRYDVLIRAYQGNELDRRIAEIHRERPELPQAFAAYRRRMTTVAQLLRRGGDFPFSQAKSQAAHEDLSKYFADRAARLAAEGGAVGLVVPSVVYNGDGCVGLRRFLLKEAAVERFYGFENRRKIFPIDSRYKFVNLVFRKGTRGETFEAAFMRHDLEELRQDGPKPWLVRLSHAEIQELSPGTLAFLEYRSPRDQEIVHRMHRGRPTLGGEGPGAWGVTFVTDRQHDKIYNSARDKDLWTDPGTGRLFTPQSVLGYAPHDLGETILLMREQGFWPVWEGKSISQFIVGMKPPRWWLKLALAGEKYEKLPQGGTALVFRATARNTDERTAIAAVLPEEAVASDTISALRLNRIEPDAACTVLNSLCFDYLLRIRLAGTKVAWTYLNLVAVPPANTLNNLSCLPTVLGWESNTEHITDRQDLWPLLWLANRAVAEAYGLTPDDFAHILSTFPVMARKRPRFFAYLQERLKEWQAEGRR